MAHTFAPEPTLKGDLPMAPSTMTRTHALRTAGTVLTCAVAAGALAGCSSGNAPSAASATPSVSTSKSPPSDPDQAAKDKVLTAYTNTREIQIKTAADGKLRTEELAKFAKGDAAADLKGSALLNTSENIKFTGRPEMSPTVTSVDIKSRTATLFDCFDSTNWKPVDRNSGKAVQPAEQRLKYPVTSQATLEGDTWLITKITADRTKDC
ncbi:hypothetical protein AB0D54_37340 [Streptomyces xanthophaeus]|uniref:hypothetical protein n=1 Tax=Streptomyces xanthophaeus TaxID=67385 RepID=UPI00342561EB